MAMDRITDTVTVQAWLSRVDQDQSSVEDIMVALDIMWVDTDMAVVTAGSAAAGDVNFQTKT